MPTEEEIVKNRKDGEIYVFGSQPVLADKNGVPLRVFDADVSDGNMPELPLEKEVVTKFDLEEYKKRKGQLDPEGIYDIIELGYWCGEEYCEPDWDAVAQIEADRKWAEDQKALDNDDD